MAIKITSRELQARGFSRSETVTFTTREHADVDALGKALTDHRNACDSRRNAKQPIRPVKVVAAKKM